MKRLEELKSRFIVDPPIVIDCGASRAEKIYSYAEKSRGKLRFEIETGSESWVTYGNDSMGALRNAWSKRPPIRVGELTRIRQLTGMLRPRWRYVDSITITALTHCGYAVIF